MMRSLSVSFSFALGLTMLGHSAAACDLIESLDGGNEAYLPMYYHQSSGWAIRGADLYFAASQSDSSIAFFKKIVEVASDNDRYISLIVSPPRALFAPDNAFTSAAAAMSPGASKEDLLSGYRQLVESLSEAGFIVPDLYEELSKQKDAFFLRDHHWTGVGSRHAASALWSLLMDKNLITVGNKADRFTAVGSAVKVVDGSYNRILKERCSGNFPAEDFAHPVIEKISASNSKSIEESLFDDVKTESILLLGSSFSTDAEGLQFANALSMWLNSEIDNAAVSGSGMLGSSDLLLGRGDDFKIPSLTIFEVVSQYFTTSGAQERQAFSPLVTGDCESVGEVAKINNESWSQWINLGKRYPVVRVDTGLHQEDTLSVQLKFEHGDTSNLPIKKSNFTPTDFRNGIWQTIVAGAGSADMEAFPQQARFKISGGSVQKATVYGCNWG